MEKYYVTKRFGPYSTSHRHHAATSHCRFIHGYGRYCEVVFGCKKLDHLNWVIDFGGLTKAKEWFTEHWDHKVLVSRGDPKLDQLALMEEEGLIQMILHEEKYRGIEGQCLWVKDALSQILAQVDGERVYISEVTIYEHENNSATCKF